MDPDANPQRITGSIGGVQMGSLTASSNRNYFPPIIPLLHGTIFGMKVLHLNNYADGSGADLAFADTVAALREYGDVENYVATADPAHPADLLFDSWKDRQGPGKLAYIYSGENRRRLWDFLVRHRPDVIHAHGFYADISPSILGPISAARQYWNLKFVQTSHSHELVCANASAYDYRQGRICTDCRGKRPKWKIFYRNCDRRGWMHSWIKGVRCMLAQEFMHQERLLDQIVCPSRMMFDSLLLEGIAPDKLSLVRNPVAFERPPAGAVRDNEMVFFGRFAPEKDVPALADAFVAFQATHPDWRLLLIGEGPEQPGLEARYGANPAVQFLPFMPRKALFERISRARVMLMSSYLLENAPLVIPEAVLCGLWPVVPDHGGMAEMIDYLGVGSSYRHGDRGALQVALEAVSGMLPQAEARLAAARQLIETELAPARYAQEIQGLYARLLQ